jgi:hypothetical protein
VRNLAFQKLFVVLLIYFRWVLLMPGKGGEEAGECKFLNLSAEIARFMGVTIQENLKVMTDLTQQKLNLLLYWFACEYE